PPPPPPPAPPEELEVLEEDDEEKADQIADFDQDSDETEVVDVPEEVEEEPEEDNTVYQIVEDQPEFPGGMGEMMKFLATETKYPPQAIDNNIQGRAFISFTVEKDGSITDVQSAAPPGKEVHKLLVKEAKRVVSSMPKWKPGKQRGKPVRVKYTVPVNFKIR
ncbi:MAG: energy transducer TonB, partial [Flavobacteriales bacterium]|nr:energy transducer TonB [Flavobacteriales bacterium]